MMSSFRRNVFGVMVLCVIVGNAVHKNYKVEIMPQKFVFEKVGGVAVGLQKAHIVTKIGFKKMEEMHKSLENFVEKNITSLITHSQVKLKKSFMHRNIVMKRNMRRAKVDISSAKMGFMERAKDLRKNPHFVPFPRVRRSLIEGMGMVTGVATLGMSIYNYVEIQEIRDLEKNDRRAIESMAVSIKNVDAAVNRNSRNINILKKVEEAHIKMTMRDEHEMAMEDLLTQSEEATDRWMVSTRFWSAGIKSLLQGRLDPSLLDLEKLLGAAGTIEKLARENGKELVYNKIDSLLNAEFSWMFDEKEESLSIILHIDVACSKKMQAYRLLSVPFMVGEKSLAFLSDKNGDVLVIDENNDVGKIVKRVELEKCQKSGKNFACDNFGLLQRKIGKSCLGAALRGRMKDSLQSCQIDRLLNQSVRIKIVSMYH